MIDNKPFYLDQLSPPEVLQLLIKGAAVSHGLLLNRLRLILPSTPPCQFVTLELPDPQAIAPNLSTADRPAYQILFNTLVDTFKEITRRTPLVLFPGGDARELPEAFAWLLIESTPGTEEHPAPSTGSQLLMVTPPIQETEAEVLFKHLLFHATSTRLTSVESGSPPTASRYLFHVMDDPQRKSSFQAIAAAGIFKDCTILKGFEVDGYTTFFPMDATPDELTLRYFCRLFQVAPLLFSRREKEKTSLTAAFLIQDSQREFLYLGGLHFYGEERFTQRKVRDVPFQYMDLQQSARSLKGLEETIRLAQPYVGYHLELRGTAYMEKNTLERLQEQKARLEYNLAYLQSIARPRPLLMRFTQQQLPALAAEIRSFPIHTMLEGSVKYGFQASQEQPAGYHFLLIDPATTTRLESDPFLLWQDLDVPHMRFRLDPFWANHYFDTGGLTQAMVFVPQGHTIYPPLHSWQQESMDLYLRETMSYWFAAPLAGRDIPTRPIYLFDGDATSKTPISIFILDQDRFEPLHTRLGWLNDNLVLNRVLEKEALIKEMAKDITWTQAAQAIKDNREETHRQFEESAQAAARNMAETTTEISQLFTTEINRVVRDTFRMAEKIKRTDQRLQEWDKVCADMEETLKQVQQQWQQTLHEKTNIQNEFQKIEQDIQQELDTADTRRQQMETLLEEEIKKMQITNHKLRARLSRIKF